MGKAVLYNIIGGDRIRILIMESTKVSSSRMCPQYSKKGSCIYGDKCGYMHQDCPTYLLTQKCPDPRCSAFHRQMCNNLLKQGKCHYQNCGYLHDECDRVEGCGCFRYHPLAYRGLCGEVVVMELIPDQGTAVKLSRRCRQCHTDTLLVYADCGCQNTCKHCFKNNSTCSDCHFQVNNYIE